MITHELNLAAAPFAAIKSGAKTIESRLYDEKRQKIALGDQIVFINREDPSQVIHTEVTALLRYASFQEMFLDNGAEAFGGSSASELLEQIRQFYSPEDEQKYGVLGIKLHVLDTK